MYHIGVALGKYLTNPNPENAAELKQIVRATSVKMPFFSDKWLSPLVKENLLQQTKFKSDSASEMSMGSRFSLLLRHLQSES